MCSCKPSTMGARPVFTLDDVLREIDGNEEYVDDSEDEFDGYVEMDEIEDKREHMLVLILR